MKNVKNMKHARQTEYTEIEALDWPDIQRFNLKKFKAIFYSKCLLCFNCYMNNI